MIPGSKFIYCADAGLGSYNIRKFNSMGGRAFIVTQSIKKLSSTLKKAVFNDCDYKLLSDDSPVTIEEMKNFDRHDPDNLTLYKDCAYKVIPFHRILFSRRVSWNALHHSGLFWFPPDPSEPAVSLPALSADPLPERIRAHFLICYTSLLVYRLLEARLDDQKTHVTPDHLVTTLKNMNVTNIHDIDYMALYKGSKALDALTRLTMLPLDRRHYRPKDLNRMIKKFLS